MINFLLAIYAFNCIRKLLSGNLSWHLSCMGGDDDDSEAKYETAVAPSREYQADMQQLFKEVYKPYVQDISGLWTEYGKPIKTEQMQAYQGVLPKLVSDVQTPWDESEMKSVFDKIWRQTRERTAAEYAPIEQRTSQRLAGAGALDTGASMKMFGDIEQAKYKSLETQAIDMALQEYNVKAQAKQQSYSNLFAGLNYQPLDTGAITGVGGWKPEVIPPYIAGEEGGWSWGGMGAGALSGAGTGAMLGGPLGAVIGGVAGAGLGGLSGYSGGEGQDLSALFKLLQQSGGGSSSVVGGQGGQLFNTAQFGQTWSPYL